MDTEVVSALKDLCLDFINLVDAIKEAGGLDEKEYNELTRMKKSFIDKT